MKYRLDIQQVAGLLKQLAWAAVGIALAGLLFYLWPVARRVNSASATLLECQYRDQAGNWHGNGACLQSSILAIVGSVKASGAAIARAAPEVAGSIKASAANSVSASQETAALAKAGTDAIRKLGGTIDAGTKAVQDLDQKAAGALDAITTTAEHTDRRLNGEEGALAAVTADLQKTGTVLEQLAGDRGLLAEGTGLVKAAGGLVVDLAPDLKRTAHGLGEASEKGSSAMGHVDATLGYVEQAFTPKKIGFWKGLGVNLLPWGVRQAAALLYPQRVAIANEPTVKVSPAEKK